MQAAATFSAEERRVGSEVETVEIVAIEFGLTRARQFTESEFLDGSDRLERAWKMTQGLELYLTTCQVGITASSIAVGIVAEPALAALFEPLFGGTALASVGAGALIAYFIINPRTVVATRPLAPEGLASRVLTPLRLRSRHRTRPRRRRTPGGYASPRHRRGRTRASAAG